MEYDQAKKQEEAVWKRMYEYVCCFYLKKRKTRKYRDAKARVCTVCKKERIAQKQDKKQIKMF